MPIYVYKNLATGETFEVQQRITEPALTEHPDTGEPVKRMIQPVGIAFKGPGFYVTDSRGKGNGKATPAKSESASENKSESKSETKNETKSESKTESKSEGKKESASSSTT